LTEGVEVIERLWMGEPVTYEGRHFQLRDVRLSLRPVQRPRPRIWLAANTDAGVKRAAKLGDAWLMNPHSTLPSLERQLALFHETRRALGRPRAADIPLIKECVVAEDGRTALAEARPFLEAKYRAYQQWKQDEALPEGETFDLSFDDLARDRFIVGDPSRAVDEIARYRERLGVTELNFRVQWPGMPQATVLRSIRLLGEKVLPKLR
jgi:alkanesulfonate monooxygenase SsuD/methylene tetrahydromethanopterin reductase-like flavin-dependent oxidoreductase (luciferase family)